jgi:hypothetical protein
MASKSPKPDRKAEAYASYLRHRKLTFVFGWISLATPFFAFITLFFLAGMTSGPFAAFAQAAAWPIVFASMLSAPLCLAVAFVESFRSRNIREMHGFEKPRRD